jgi:ATP-dependent RNA helicase DDX35
VSREVSDPSLVGYSVRFASTYNPGVTRIRYVTDGWLLRETTLLDPLLRRCSVLIIDEAHERGLNTELLLGAVKKIRRARPELRVVICSARNRSWNSSSEVAKIQEEEEDDDDDGGEGVERRRRWGGG